MLYEYNLGPKVSQVPSVHCSSMVYDFIGNAVRFEEIVDLYRSRSLRLIIEGNKNYSELQSTTVMHSI